MLDLIADLRMLFVMIKEKKDIWFTLHGAKHRKMDPIMVILQVKTLNWNGS